MAQQSVPSSDADLNCMPPALVQQLEFLLEKHMSSVLQKNLDVLFCRLKALLQESSEGGCQAKESEGASRLPDSIVEAYAANAEDRLDESVLVPHEDTLESHLNEYTLESYSHEQSFERVRVASWRRRDVNNAANASDALDESVLDLDETPLESLESFSAEQSFERVRVAPVRRRDVNALGSYDRATKGRSRPLRHPTSPTRQERFRPSVRSDTSYSTEVHKRIAHQKSMVRQTTPPKTDCARGPPQHHTWMRQTAWRIIKSVRFEIFIAGTIITNSVFIGVQVEYAAQNPGQQAPMMFSVFSIVYTLIFASELLLRLLASGPKFFYGSANLGWNYLDVLIVISSLLEILFAAASGDHGGTNSEASMMGSMRLVRVLRVTRILRVIRIVKLVRFIRALRSLVYSIIFTLRGLAWSMVLLMLIIYVFAIVFTDATSQHASDLFGEEQRSAESALTKRFGSLHVSMHTLFRCISDGLTWDPVVESLIQVNWALGYLFSMYIAFCCFAVLNVMTAVFCQSAKDSAEKDHDLMVQMHAMDKQRCNVIINKLFQSMDTRKSGSITLYEFEKEFQDESVKAFFKLFGLDPVDAWTLFMLLDAEGTGDVDAEEFSQGCLKLRGPAKSIDIAVLMHDNRLMKKRLQQIEARSRQLVEQVAEVKSLCSRMSGQYHSTSYQM